MNIVPTHRVLFSAGLLALVCASPSGEAAVYKCPSASGATTFSDKPCPNAQRKDGHQWIDVEEETRRKREEEHRLAAEAARLRTEREEAEARRKATEKLRQTTPPASPSHSSSANAKPSSQSISMSFEQCISKRESVIASLGVNPRDIKPIVDTGLMTMTRICTNDGSVLITCSSVDQKMIITQSSAGKDVGCR